MTDGSPKHSLLITTCERYYLLDRQIDNITNMRPMPNEVIIIDDTPQNKSENLDKYQDALDERGIICKIIPTSGGRRANYCRNLAIQTASSDYLTLLDDDDVLAADYFHQMPISALRDEKLAIYGSKFFVKSSDFTNVVRKKQAVKSLVGISQLVKKNYVGGTSGVTFHRKTLLENNTLFREDMPALQDYEFWLRLAANGFVFMGEPNCIVYYTIHADNGQVSRNPQKYKTAIKMLGKADNLNLTTAQFISLKISLFQTRLKSIIRSKMPAFEKVWFFLTSADKRRNY